MSSALIFFSDNYHEFFINLTRLCTLIRAFNVKYTIQENTEYSRDAITHAEGETYGEF